jgi:ABC-type taurine transport system ATPase subunit
LRHKLLHGILKRERVDRQLAAPGVKTRQRQEIGNDLRHSVALIKDDVQKIIFHLSGQVIVFGERFSVASDARQRRPQLV